MEAIIFTGIQATGKTAFYAQRFLRTHIRLNMDMLRTRHRESILLRACLDSKQPFVVDNTNPTSADRERYIVPARAAQFRVVGYYFQSQVEACKLRNELRPAAEVVPDRGLLGTYRRLELPRYDEGFDELHYVRIGEDGGFVVEEWSDEVCRS